MIVGGACYHGKQPNLGWIQRQTGLRLLHNESVNISNRPRGWLCFWVENLIFIVCMGRQKNIASVVMQSNALAVRQSSLCWMDGQGRECIFNEAAMWEIEKIWWTLSRGRRTDVEMTDWNISCGFRFKPLEWIMIRTFSFWLNVQ